MSTRTGRKARSSSRKRKKSFVRFISVFRQEVELNATKANLEIAKDISEEAKDVIETQRYRWKPLSEEYKERKQQMGYDERIYIRTGEFVDKIGYGTKNGKVWIGFPPDAEHTGEMARSDEPTKPPISMSLLAKFLEFGTKTIPARNLWRPLMSKFIRGNVKFAKKYRKALKEAVASRTK